MTDGFVLTHPNLCFGQKMEHKTNKREKKNCLDIKLSGSTLANLPLCTYCCSSPNDVSTQNRRPDAALLLW